VRQLGYPALVCVHKLLSHLLRRRRLAACFELGAAFGRLRHGHKGVLRLAHAGHLLVLAFVLLLFFAAARLASLHVFLVAFLVLLALLVGMLKVLHGLFVMPRCFVVRVRGFLMRGMRFLEMGMHYDPYEMEAGGKTDALART
jgi:hypothetical protein